MVATPIQLAVGGPGEEHDGAAARGATASAFADDATDRIAAHVAAVDELLDRELAAVQEAWDRGAGRGIDAPSLNPPAQLRQLVHSGGKRIRPVMTLLGWLSVEAGDGGHRPGHDDVVLASAALEMLHCFALVHDDVMDESPTRRGAPTVHESASRLHTRRSFLGRSTRFGESVAMLVGDLAHSEADRLAASLPTEMRRIWQQMVLELLAGQLRDVVGSAAADRRLGLARLVARQKSGYYTVGRPLQLGAAAAGADVEVLAALTAYGRHAGEAFALRDDILGAFGDPGTTGKPAGDDIRAGKPTVLLALATETLRGRPARALEAAGSQRMTTAQVRLVRDAMLRDGVVDRVEAMIDERVADAVSALRTPRLSADGVARLTRIVDDLARRGR